MELQNYRHADDRACCRRSSGKRCAQAATLVQCHEVIDTLEQHVAELQREVAWLHERVTLNSRMSSNPPSSDAPGNANRAQRRAS